jgi:hypothetical protein
MLYLCGHKTIKLLVMNSTETKLRESLGKMEERPLTYNEWCEKFNVSGNYVEPTKYFQGNPSSGFVPMDVSTSPLERFLNLFTTKV